MYVKLKVSGFVPYKEFDDDLDDTERLIKKSLKVNFEKAKVVNTEKFEIFELESVDRVEEVVCTDKDGNVGTSINVLLTDGSTIGPFEMSAQEFLSVSSNMLSSVQDFQFFRNSIRKF
jgi:hypothetical protein